MKKSIMIVIFLLLILVFSFGCKKQEPSELEIITISGTGSFEIKECDERGLSDKIIMVGSKYCPHCLETKPDFIEVCEAKGIEPEIFDLAEEDDRNKMNSYGFEVQFTPTFIYGCEYHVGAKTKEEYLKFCEEFLEI